MPHEVSLRVQLQNTVTGVAIFYCISLSESQLMGFVGSWFKDLVCFCMCAFFRSFNLTKQRRFTLQNGNVLFQRTHNFKMFTGTINTLQCFLSLCYHPRILWKQIKQYSHCWIKMFMKRQTSHEERSGYYTRKALFKDHGKNILVGYSEWKTKHFAFVKILNAVFFVVVLVWWRTGREGMILRGMSGRRATRHPRPLWLLLLYSSSRVQWRKWHSQLWSRVNYPM